MGPTRTHSAGDPLKTEAAFLQVARSRPADYLTLTKPRVNGLVIASAAAAYYLGSAAGFDLVRFINTIVGTALVAGGAAALNQAFERRIDALMERTRSRPVPDGRLSTADARWFGLALAGIGVVELALGANLLSAAIALVTLVTYAWVYTPLKTRTSFATVIGAVPGALPPMIGWAAATGTMSREAWILFAIVFFWQLPHFLAIAWMYREDYARAGVPLLPVLEPDGRSTALQIVLYTSALVPVSLLPTVVGLGGDVYFGAGLLLGIAFLAASLVFARQRTRTNARALFLASIVYLPVLWMLLVLDRVG